MTITTETTSRTTFEIGDRVRLVSSEHLVASPGAYGVITDIETSGNYAFDFVRVEWDRFTNDLHRNQMNGYYTASKFERVEAVTIMDEAGYYALPAGVKLLDKDGDYLVLREDGTAALTCVYSDGEMENTGLLDPDEATNYLPMAVLNPEILGDFATADPYFELFPDEEPLAEWEKELLGESVAADWSDPIVHTAFEAGDKVRVSDNPKCITAVDREGQVTDRYAGKVGVVLKDDSDIFKLGNYVVKVEDPYFNTQFIAPEHLTLVREPAFEIGARLKVIGNDATNPAGEHHFEIGDVVNVVDGTGYSDIYDPADIVAVRTTVLRFGSYHTQWIKASDLTDTFPEYEDFGFEVGQEFTGTEVMDELPQGAVVYLTDTRVSPSIKAGNGNWYYSPTQGHEGVRQDSLRDLLSDNYYTAVIAYLP